MTNTSDQEWVERKVRFLNEMDERLKTIQRPEDLSAYLFFLADGYTDGFFERQSPSEYLDGAAAVLEDFDDWMESQNIPPRSNPDWQLVGQILTTAFYHS